MTNHCGECNACCKVFAIPDLKKAGEWCKHCDIGKSCRIYDERPLPCSTFKCVWLQSQEQDRHQMEADMRPDKCKVVFSETTNSNVVSAIPMGAISTRAQKFITSLVHNGLRVLVGKPGGEDFVLHDSKGARPIKMSAPDHNGMQWNVK